MCSIHFKPDDFVRRGIFRKRKGICGLHGLSKTNLVKLGVSNGLCEHSRACEHCVYFCEHEQLLNFSCEQRAL